MSMNKPRTVPQTKTKEGKKERKEKKHLEVKLFLSHAQAKFCSKMILGLAYKEARIWTYVPLQPEMLSKREVKHRMIIFGSAETTGFTRFFSGAVISKKQLDFIHLGNCLALLICV